MLDYDIKSNKKINLNSNNYNKKNINQIIN